MADKLPPTTTASNDWDGTSLVVYLSKLTTALNQFHWESVKALCDELVQRLRAGMPAPAEKPATKILSELRRKRQFAEVRWVADALIAAGQNSPGVRKMYVQALLDEGDLAAGLALAQSLLDDKSAESQWSEAQGLVGRAHKQRYVLTGDRQWLQKAVDAYLPPFKKEPAKHLWHGINAVALLSRAAVDFGGLPSQPNPQTLALEILQTVQKADSAGKTDYWDRATAVEACIALRRFDDALRWAVDYVHTEGTDAFELYSTVRQLKEIWRLNERTEPGKLLLPLLEAELLKRRGGSVPLTAEAAEVIRVGMQGAELEKVFGADSYKTVTWMQTALERCRAVARIETESEQGVGTGFLVREQDFWPGGGEGQLLLTNAHVLLADDSTSSSQAIRPRDAYLRFEMLDTQKQPRRRVASVLARSADLDFALARIEGRVEGATPLALSELRPSAGAHTRLYAIGHPLGGKIAFSLHDNLLIDFRDPHLQYRTPTDPGSSGSPIFDEEWKLVALHHAGNREMRKLTGEGRHQANEGIWIPSIRNFLKVGSPVKSSSEGIASRPAESRSLQSFTPQISPTVTGRTNMGKNDLLRNYARQIASEDRLDEMRTEAPSFAESAQESAASMQPDFQPEPTSEDVAGAIDAVQQGKELNPSEMFALEAIVLPRERPVVFIQGDTFVTPESPWEHFFTNSKIKSTIDSAIKSIGRVELPSNSQVPFGGTAFVVGNGLLMTNRHVAELFAVGVGSSIVFRAGQTAGWDYRREHKTPDDGTMLHVNRIVMIHPYWDMALLSVTGLTSAQKPLTLSVTPAADLRNSEVAVIGYPAKDWRNDSDLQDRIFKRVYNVKRLQPGKIKGTGAVSSFGNNVSAMTHDSSTLGGNSGSAIIGVKSGQVIGLHFAGRYLEANYSVPAYELARDPRVVAAGVKFAGTVRSNASLDAIWRRLRDESLTQPQSEPRRHSGTTTGSIRVKLGESSISIPVEIDIEGLATSSESVAAGPIDVLEAIKTPVIFPRLDKREGYKSDFLAGFEVPLPTVTSSGKKIVAKLEDDTFELKYHHFSVVMHKKRRFALFTAANVDWRDRFRKVNGKKPSRDELNGFNKNDSELWITDERIPEIHQLPDVFFTKDRKAFDRGHLVRRDDVAWGKSFKDMQKGNGDTFHTTNCSPQIGGFNQSSQGEDNWGDLENMIQKQSSSERVIVFSGPVLDDENDEFFEGEDERGEVEIQIPSSYWKIVVASDDTSLQAFGFVLEQDLSDVQFERETEFAVPAPWQNKMKSISEIEDLLFGHANLDSLKEFDQLKKPAGRLIASNLRKK